MRRSEIASNGQAIMERRILAGLSKSDVARAAGIPQSSIARAERGGGATAKVAVGICTALGADFDDLFVIKYRSDGQATAQS